MKFYFHTLLTKNDSGTDETVFEDMPEFQYYDFENHFFANYYIYMTLFCQGVTYIGFSSTLFTNYRKWNILGSFWLICLPVDVLILYKEPFGMEGTMVLITLAFVPFLVTMSFYAGE